MQVIAKASKTLAHDKALGIAEVNVLKVMLQFLILILSLVQLSLPPAHSVFACGTAPWPQLL